MDVNGGHLPLRGEDADGREALGAAAPIRRYKAATSINVKDFDSQKDEFERWVLRFEKAVKLATNMRDGDPPLHNTYKE